MAENKRASILFAPKEAAGLDLEQIRQIAMEGYSELLQWNPQLSAEGARVFSSELQNTDRELLTKAEGDKLGKML